MSISKYPLDFDELKEGDIITTEQIETAMSCKATDRDYNFKKLALAAMIEKETGFVAKSQNYTELKILSNEERPSYSQKIERMGIQKMVRCLNISQGTDRERLSPAEKIKLEQQELRQGRMLQAMRKVRRKVISEQKSNQLKE